MSVRLFRPENRLTFENLLTPVMKLNRTCASQSLMVEYRPRRKSRLARAISGASSAFQNRPVVLVHQHGDGLAGVPVQSFQQSSEPSGDSVILGVHDSPAFCRGELLHDVQFQMLRLLEIAAAEAEAQHGIPHRPVPPVVDGQSLEQRLVALEQLLARVQEQALAEAPRARQEVVLALVEQARDEGGLVHVVAVLLPDLCGRSACRWAACVE